MTTGWVLIFAVLFLGGVIATVGDRLGMRVGKARLSLFNLRPRQTATLITILTGGLISASTLGVLLAVSSQLRTGLFELQNIQDELETTQQDLESATAEREEVEARLQQARRQRQTAERDLRETNRSLQASQERQRQTQAQLQQTQSRFQQAQSRLEAVTRQEASLRSQIEQLQSDQQELIQRIDQADQQIAQRDREILARNQAIAERQSRLEQLEQQRTALEVDVEKLQQQIASLQQEYDTLRSGNVAVFRDQPLASIVLNVETPNVALRRVSGLLLQANQAALERVLPGNNRNQQVIQITNAEVEQLINQIKDGRQYLVQIVSDGNYVQGEPCVQAGRDCLKVYGRAFLNQQVFSSNQVVASVPVNLPLSQDALVERYTLLISAVLFQARQKGMPPGTLVVLANDDSGAVESFLRKVSELQQPIDLQAVAASDIATIDPLRIELQAVQNGQVLFNTKDALAPAAPPPDIPPLQAQ